MDHSLNCLLPDKFQFISYKDNPLLFILCVGDLKILVKSYGRVQ